MELCVFIIMEKSVAALQAADGICYYLNPNMI